MPCKQRLQTLPCSLRGVGYLAEPVGSAANTLTLMKGQGANFPTLTDDQFFFVSVEGCKGCCEQMRVVARDGDTLTVERTNHCDCIDSNARVAYDYTSREYILAIVRELGIEVTSPLTYDCESNTLSIDCNKLATDSDCGCGSGKNAAGVGQRGPQGPAGRDGKDGLGVASIHVADDTNVLTWTDSLGQRHTAGTITASRGPQGERGDVGPVGSQGERGPQGEKGERGPQGEKGVGITSHNINQDGELELVYSNGESANVGRVVGPRGPQGATASFSVLHNAGKVYIAGPAGEEVYLRKSGAVIGGRQVIPGGGVLTMDNPNVSEAALIELVNKTDVVALGWF